MATVDLSAYKNLYIESSREYLEIMKKNLTELNKDPLNKEATYELFRCAHSLKSQNYAMGYKNTAELCKSLEDFFHKINDGYGLYRASLSESITSVVSQLESNLDHINKRNNEIISLHQINNLKHKLGLL